MGGESRAVTGRSKNRVNPPDGPRQDETSTGGGGADETRMYAKLILIDVKKLKVEVDALSLKCTEEVEVVDLEAEEENGGGDDDALSGFRKEMEKNCGELHDQVLSLRELVESLATRAPTSSTIGTADSDQTRTYAKLIQSKVRKLKVDLATLSLKCSETGSTSGEVEVVDLEAEEGENAGRGNHGPRHRHGNYGLNRLKKEMEESYGRVHMTMDPMCKLAESLAHHVKDPDSEPESSTRTPRSSSSSATPSNAFELVSDEDSKDELELLKLGTKVTPLGRLNTKPMNPKKERVGSGRSKPGPSSSTSDGAGDAEEQRARTEAVQLTVVVEDRTYAGVSKERIMNRNNYGGTVEQAVNAPAAPRGSPSFPKETPGPSIRPPVLNQSLRARDSTTQIIGRDDLMGQKTCLQPSAAFPEGTTNNHPSSCDADADTGGSSSGSLITPNDSPSSTTVTPANNSPAITSANRRGPGRPPGRPCSTGGRGGGGGGAIGRRPIRNRKVPARFADPNYLSLEDATSTVKEATRRISIQQGTDIGKRKSVQEQSPPPSAREDPLSQQHTEDEEEGASTPWSKSPESTQSKFKRSHSMKEASSSADPIVNLHVGDPGKSISTKPKEHTASQLLKAQKEKAPEEKASATKQTSQAASVPKTSTTPSSGQSQSVPGTVPKSANVIEKSMPKIIAKKMEDGLSKGTNASASHPSLQEQDDHVSGTEKSGRQGTSSSSTSGNGKGHKSSSSKFYLVRRTPRQIAPCNMAQWRKQEEKRGLETIKRAELDKLGDAVKITKKTKPGDIRDTVVDPEDEKKKHRRKSNESRSSSSQYHRDRDRRSNREKDNDKHRHSGKDRDKDKKSEKEKELRSRDRDRDHKSSRDKDKDKHSHSHRDKDKKSEKGKHRRSSSSDHRSRSSHHPDKYKERSISERGRGREQEQRRSDRHLENNRNNTKDKEQELRNRDRDREKSSRDKAKDKHSHSDRDRDKDKKEEKERHRSSSSGGHKTSHRPYHHDNNKDRSTGGERDRDKDHERRSDRHEEKDKDKVKQDAKGRDSEKEKERYIDKTGEKLSADSQNSKSVSTETEDTEMKEKTTQNIETTTKVKVEPKEEIIEESGSNVTTSFSGSTPPPTPTVASTATPSASAGEMKIKQEVHDEASVESEQEFPSSTIQAPYFAEDSNSTGTKEGQQEPLFQATLQLQMPALGDLKASFFNVSHNDNSLKGPYFPDSPIPVVGIIDHDTVWGYIEALKKSEEIIIFRVSPATVADSNGYMTYFKYLSSRERLGVIGGLCSPLKHAFILPLEKEQPMPEILQPFPGPGLPKERTPCLLAIVIRHVVSGGLKRKLSAVGAEASEKKTKMGVDRVKNGSVKMGDQSQVETASDKADDNEPSTPLEDEEEAQASQEQEAPDTSSPTYTEASKARTTNRNNYGAAVEISTVTNANAPRRSPRVPRVAAGPSIPAQLLEKTLPAKDCTKQIIGRGDDLMNLELEARPQSISGIPASSSSSSIDLPPGSTSQASSVVNSTHAQTSGTSTSNQLGTQMPGPTGAKGQRRKKNAMDLECIFCQRKFTFKIFLENHIRSHIGERPHFCGLCPYECSRKGALKAHLETHKSDREREFQCDICSKRLFSNWELKLHTRRHTVEQEFKCKFCKMCFRWKHCLTSHIRRVHENKRSFKCDVCPKAFYSNSHLKRHTLVHTGEGRKKKHSCGICDMKFTRKDHLEFHVRTHSGVSLRG